MNKFLSIIFSSILILFSFAASVSAADNLYFLHTDHLGSTRVVTDKTGTVVAKYDYYPYGAINYQLPPFAEASGGGPTTNSLPTERLYTSQISDESTDLYFYNSRYYNPAIGAFISADPVQGPNRYAYVSNNPMNKTDPNGTQGVPIEKRPWFVENELIPEVKELYGVTLKSGSPAERILARDTIFAKILADPRQWSAKEIFTLEALFKTIDPYMYEGRVVEHFRARDVWGGRATLGSNRILIASGECLMGEIFLHEATHNISTPERIARFLAAAEADGVSWVTLFIPPGEGRKDTLWREGYRAHPREKVSRLDVSSRVPTTDRSSGYLELLADFGMKYYTDPSYIKEGWPNVFNLFERWGSEGAIGGPGHRR